MTKTSLFRFGGVPMRTDAPKLHFAPLWFGSGGRWTHDAAEAAAADDDDGDGAHLFVAPRSRTREKWLEQQKVEQHKSTFLLVGSVHLHMRCAAQRT